MESRGTKPRTRSVAWQLEACDQPLVGEQFIAALPEHEFTLPRQLVADAAVVSVEHATLPEPRLTVELELLLLDDC